MPENGPSLPMLLCFRLVPPAQQSPQLTGAKTLTSLQPVRLCKAIDMCLSSLQLYSPSNENAAILSLFWLFACLVVGNQGEITIDWGNDDEDEKGKIDPHPEAANITFFWVWTTRAYRAILIHRRQRSSRWN